MAVEQYSNLTASTLNGAINNSVTSITVTTGSLFPSSGNFRIIIGSEIMKVTARASDVLTVVRAQEGTSAASHADLDAILLIETASALDAIFSDMQVADVLANRPAAGKVGALYLPDDSGLISRDNGSTFDYFYPLWKMTPPVLGDFTWSNQGSCTTDTARGGIDVTVPSDTGLSLRVLYKAKTPPYKVTGYFQLSNMGHSYQSCGMGFFDGTGGKLVSMHFIVFDGDYCYAECCNWNSTTSFNAAPAYMFLGMSSNLIGWMQIEHNGTNLYFRISIDGRTWIDVYSAGKTAFMANDPNRCMFYGRNNTNLQGHTFNLMSWKEE